MYTGKFVVPLLFCLTLSACNDAQENKEFMNVCSIYDDSDFNGEVSYCSCVYNKMAGLHGSEWYKKAFAFNAQQAKVDLVDIGNQCKINIQRY
ncbi:hypothetical protein [Budvicia aquatica]|uniref:Lipoprotein n=1 Tax=Budvicia aquatica TaxID=82979 RepID=A0A2C6C6P0_9GAMM|nr:hypothetical protein [Budvicia aquatica]PHI32010.1 hypothetical protein CRN84_23145 [Budvicia aquatica]VFS53071.1 Uncharacterised protein [Budvicia aquatica]